MSLTKPRSSPPPIPLFQALAASVEAEEEAIERLVACVGKGDPAEIVAAAEHVAAIRQGQ